MADVMKFVRFVAVGLFNTGFFFLVFWAVHKLAGAERWVAVTIAFVSSTTAQYIGHAAFTFDRKLQDAWQLVRFAVTIVLGYVTTQAIMLIGPKYGAPDTVLGILVVIGLAGVNWFVFLLWVFRGQQS
jgi:putative flippase GtrA